MAQISVKKDNDEKILCPHCGEEITTIMEKTAKTGALNITKKAFMLAVSVVKLFQSLTRRTVNE